MDIDLVWEQHPGNPLISPEWPEWLVGDPVVLSAEESPDGKWHMFMNTILWVMHYVSGDGVKWKRLGKVCRGMRAFLLCDDEYYLFYERPRSMTRSSIYVRRSPDLVSWSGGERILKPEFDWEKEHGSVVSCPCVVKVGDLYRMYYSTSQCFLKDLGFSEPKYIGVAEADNILGPYEKGPEPIMGPDPDDPYRNQGAGAIKVYRDEENDRWVGFNNGIYEDADGHSRSAIFIMTSTDGINWKQESDEPVIAPDEGWRKALVYQMCIVKRPGGEMWMYYNSRDEWKIAREHIGLEIGRPRK